MESIVTRFFLEIFFWGILVKVLISGDITNWLRHKGLIQEKQHGVIWKLLDFIYNGIMATKNYFAKLILNQGRNALLWQHVSQHQGHFEQCRKCS